MTESIKTLDGFLDDCDGATDDRAMKLVTWVHAAQPPANFRVWRLTRQQSRVACAWRVGVAQ